MTLDEWRTTANPVAMIKWLGKQGYSRSLWEFATTCCRRVWDELPAGAVRRVVEHAERIGVHDIDDVLWSAGKEVEQLEQQYRKCKSDPERMKLNRQIGHARLVSAFEFQDSAEVAEAISQHLIEWANESGGEKFLQANLLRQLVPDPSKPQWDEEDDES